MAAVLQEGAEQSCRVSPVSFHDTHYNVVETHSTDPFLIRNGKGDAKERAVLATSQLIVVLDANTC